MTRLLVFVLASAIAGFAQTYTYNETIQFSSNSIVSAIPGFGTVPSPLLPSGISSVTNVGYSGHAGRLDLSYSLPVGGTPCSAHTATDFQNCINSSSPGDVIYLDSGVTYQGNFVLPVKSNPSHKWIYVIPTGYASLPAPGNRISDSDLPNMAYLQTTGTKAALDTGTNSGVNYWRFVGISINSGSSLNCHPEYSTPQNCQTYNLGLFADCDNIFFDRVKIDPGSGQDTQHGIQFYSYNPNTGCSNVAIFDSQITNALCDHRFCGGADSNGILVTASPGPFVVTNNEITAGGEEIIFGGAGGVANRTVPNDVEITRNYLHKPESWVSISTGTTPAGSPSPAGWKYIVKDNVECKIGNKVLIGYNILDGAWTSSNNSEHGINGRSTPRTDQSGNGAYCNNITVISNYGMNANSFMSIAGTDADCLQKVGCENYGQLVQYKMVNNLFEQRDFSLAGSAGDTTPANNVAIPSGPAISGGISSVMLQHNTFVRVGTTNNRMSLGYGSYFNGGTMALLIPSNNVWITQNVFAAQAKGDSYAGTAVLSNYMNLPASPDYNTRFCGNVQAAYIQSAYTWPANNYLVPGTSAMGFVNPVAGGNWELNTPYTSSCTGGDANPAGYDYSDLQTAIANVITGQYVGGTPVITAPAAGTLPSGTVGTPYVQAWAATGGVAPYTFAVTSGSLCSGLTLSSAGVLSGTPSAHQTCTFSVTATDSATTASAPVSYSLTINLAAPLSVCTSSLPNGLIGSYYLAGLCAAGGIPPYTWTLSSGSLPSGVSVSSPSVAGTPVVSGTFPGLVFHVVDSDSPPNAVDTGSLSITIAPQAGSAVGAGIGLGSRSVIK